jgi:hypothetical protein
MGAFLLGGRKMKPARRAKISRRDRRASALLISLMFVLIFSALPISMVTLSSTNLQSASNHHNVSTALATAEPGQEVIRYWLSRAHQVVNHQAARKNINKEIPSAQEKDHGKETQ